MTTNTLPPDSTSSEVTEARIKKAADFLEKLSLFLLIVPLVVVLIYLFVPKGDFFFFFSLPLFICLPIASLFALLVQFFRTVKEYPPTSLRELILTISVLALIINSFFWLFGLMQNEH